MRLAQSSLSILAAAPLAFIGLFFLHDALDLAANLPNGWGLIAYGWPLLILWTIGCAICFVFLASRKPVLIGIVAGLSSLVIVWIFAAGRVAEVTTFLSKGIEPTLASIQALGFLVVNVCLALVLIDCVRWLASRRENVP